MKYELRIKNNIKKHFGLILVFVLSCIPLVSLLHQGLPLTHDGMDHVARIANFYKGLSEGIIFPRWAENLNWGYGHPILMFLYPLSSYVASLFHALQFSYIDSVKLVFGIGFILSGTTMYLWARQQFNEYTGIAASILYLYAPYRFIDMYVRGAIGEHMAFIFPPLILYFMFKYFKEKKSRSSLYFSGISISVALLLLAHNAISLMFVPLIGVYAVYLSVTTKQYNKLFLSFSACLLGLLVSGFFTIPAFFEGKFTLRDIVIGDEYKTRFVKNPLTFLYGPWSYGISGQFSVQIGIAQIIGILLAPVVFLKTKSKEIKILLTILFVFFLVSLFIMMPQSNFLYQIVTILKKFQFPWRFLSLEVFCSALLGSSIFLVIKEKQKKNVGLVILIGIVLLTTVTYWNSNGYINKPDSFYNGIYNGTTDTGESSPIWSIRFMEHRPKAHMETISGSARIREVSRSTTSHKYSINVLSNTARMRENTLYFPNWEVIVDGQPVIVQFQDPSERGLVTFELSKGSHSVNVVFKDTKLRIVSNMLSIIAFLIVLGIILFPKIVKKHEK